MTIDKAKLRALAEAATKAVGPYRVETDCNGVHQVIGDGSWKILSAWHTPDGKGRQNAEFIAAANPATILALLGEIEGLHAQHGRDSAELRRLCNMRDLARTQRDQLKAELAELQDLKAYATQPLRERCAEHKQLKAENEALRKDAERYRWLRDQAQMGTRHDPAVLKDGPADCCEFMFGDELDSALNAAMAKESPCTSTT